MDQVLSQIGGKPVSPIARSSHAANPQSKAIPKQGPQVTTAPVQRTPSTTQRQHLSQQGLPLVIPNPYGLKCQKMPCPGPVTQIVYEDALAPHSRNAFSQYRVQKTSQHHATIGQNVEVARMPLQGDKKQWAMPPLPPTMPGLRMGNNADTAGNAKATLNDVAAKTRLASNVGDASVVEKPKVIYNLPDKTSPTGTQAYEVTMKHMHKDGGKGQARLDMVKPDLKVDPRVGFLETADKKRPAHRQYKSAFDPSPRLHQ